jgi:hypothetical protein
MADFYKPAQLVGTKGFKGYVQTISPSVQAITEAAPSFAKVSSWPDPFQPDYVQEHLPGGSHSSLPALREVEYQKFATTPIGMGVYARQPALDPAKVVSWDSQKKSIRAFSTDLSLIDPLGSIENVTGDFLGLQQPLIGAGGSVADPLNYLGERNFGLENYPTRLLDYAFTTAPTIVAHLLGLQTTPGAPRNADGEGFFPFENRPEYWASMTNWKGSGRAPTDDELLQEAKLQAGKVSNSPSLMVPALYARYQYGRDVMVNAMSSGNERMDYMAKKELEEVVKIIRAGTTGTVSLFVNNKGEAVGPVQFANSLPGLVQQLLGGVNQVARAATTLLPGIGTPLADMLMPVSDETDQLWASLTADQRRSLFSDAGMTTMMTDVVATLPLLSGAGALVSAMKAGAKGGEFMAWASKAGMVRMAGPRLGAAGEIASITEGWTVTRATMNVAKQVVFDLAGMAPRATQGAIGGFGTTLLVMDRLMAVGMGSMLVNWGLESVVPGYAEAVGYDIDNSRPFSDSAVAGLINNIGYFSSATGGGYSLYRSVRGIPRASGRALGKTGLLGEEELRGFAAHYGGQQRTVESQAIWTRPDGASPGDAEFTVPIQSHVMSELGHEVELMEVDRVAREIINDPVLAALEPQARVDMANEALHASLQNTARRQEDLANLLQEAHSDTSFVGDLILTDEQRVGRNIVQKNAREIEDRMAARMSRQYGRTFWQRQFHLAGVAIDPANEVTAFRGWMRAEAARTGWKFNEEAAVKAWGNDVGKWEQGANQWRARDYATHNAELMEAAKVSPIETLLAHPEDYLLMRADHLFADRADYFRAAIDSLKTDTPMVPEDILREEVGRAIRTTQELDAWWSRLRRKEQPLSEDLVLRSEGIRSGEVAHPEDVNLDALNEYLQESYSTLPGRHIPSIDPMTADYPVNALARRLNAEGMYAVAYKPKDAIIAYRPVTAEQAVRVSRNAPAGYDLTPPTDFVAGDTMIHVTTDVEAVRAQGLRAQTQLADDAGEQLMHHGTNANWYVYDPAYGSNELLIGRGMYTSENPRVGHSYGTNVKVVRIPADARIFDAHAPLTQDVADLLLADLAKGAQGRFGYWAKYAGDESLIDPTRVGPGNWWAYLTNGLPDIVARGGSYWDNFVGDMMASPTFHVDAEFRNAVSDVLGEAGYEGLTHIGGRNVGGFGEHKVIVLFNPDATLGRANIIGTGIGGDVALGRSVSVYTQQAFADVAEARLKLAVRAARNEVTVEEIIQHFEDAWAPMATGLHEAWMEVAGRLKNLGHDWVDNDREGMVTAAKFYYKVDAAHPNRLADLVLDLDNGMFHNGKNTAHTAFDVDTASAYSVGIKTSPTRLAQLDPAKIGQVRVARRTETANIPTEIPRLAESEVATLEDGVTNAALSARNGRNGFLYQPVFTHDIDTMIDEGLKAGKNELKTPDDWGSAGSRMDEWDAKYANAIPMTTIRVRNNMGSATFGDVPSGAIEVMNKSGAWEVLGRMDRAFDDPVPGEGLNSWGTRLYDRTMADGTPIPDRPDSVWVGISQSQHDDMLAFGSLEATEWNRAYVRDWDYVRDGRMAQAHDYVVELDRSSTAMKPDTNPAYPGTVLLESAPKAAVKRIWSWDNTRGDYVLVKEKGRYGLEAGDFYALGTRPSEMRANSNHLWTVDPEARAQHAGWRDDTPQPLENQWEQPWSGVIEDPSYGAEPVYSHVSYVKLKDGTLLKAPFRGYPMNPGNIYLGNRTAMGRKYDSIFQGVRSWRMAEHHVAQMARIFGGRYGFTPGQVELFKVKVEALARGEAWSPIKVGKIKVTPYATARLRDDKVNEIAAGIFGKGEVKNLVTGKMETPDYARLFADAHMQAWTLNLTSGIISRVKNFDLLAIGPISTAFADWLIPVLRFKASPVFRVSELLESKVFNSLRGVNVSEEERRVFGEAGLHPNPNLLASDFGAEPMLESMFTTGQNKAAAEGMAGIFGLDDLVAGEGSTGVASSFAIWRDVDDLLSRKGLSGLKEDISDPARYKQGLMFDQQVESVKRELPAIIKARDPRAYKILSEDLKVPDAQMARFIAEDRILFGKWQRGQATFDDLLNHANRYTGVKETGIEADALKAMYETEDWKVIEVMMRVASMSAQAEAFGTHFFGSYRSALERSINHPLLGIYPASWMYKAAKEWGKFLFDNRTFGNGELRLGMFPAVAMNALVKQVNMTVAMNTGESWQDWLDNGPAKNWLFLWNLLLPGDWSSLPLPLARPLRSIARAISAGKWEDLSPWNLAADTLMGPSGRGGIGIIRDMNLSARGLYDLYNYATKDATGEWGNLAKGLSLDGHSEAPPNWSDLLAYPDTMGQTSP